jgi:uncharacterized membrane protein
MSRELWLGLKWLLLVWANAAVSFFFALHEFAAWPDLLGIACGVFAFVFLYWRLDLELLRRDQRDLRRALLWGVVLKGLTQFWPMLEMFTGLLALQTVVELAGIRLAFVTPLLITLLDGVLLSLVAGLFMLLARLALYLWGRRANPGDRSI